MARVSKKCLVNGLYIIIYEDLTFLPHIENITRKCKKVCNRLTFFADVRPNLAVQIFRSPFAQN